MVEAGRPVSVEMQGQLKDEVIAREIFMQEAQKRGLDASDLDLAVLVRPQVAHDVEAELGIGRHRRPGGNVARPLPRVVLPRLVPDLAGPRDHVELPLEVPCRRIVGIDAFARVDDDFRAIRAVDDEWRAVGRAPLPAIGPPALLGDQSVRFVRQGPAGQLRTGLVWVATLDETGSMDADQRNRIRDALATINGTFGPYGLQLVEVDAAHGLVVERQLVEAERSV